MTDAVVVALGLLCAGMLGWRVRDATRMRRRPTTSSARRILFPFVAGALSEPVLDAALRIARNEDATLVPAYLARVPMHLPMGAPLPRQCNEAMPLLEAIEQRASREGITVDSRIERGRTYRHALRELLAHERPDRVVVAADTAGTDGFDAADIAWLLEHAAGEILVLRPAHDHHLRLPRSDGSALDEAQGERAAESRNAPRVRTARWCSPDMLSRRAIR